MKFIYEIGHVTIIITEQHFIDTKPMKVQYAWEVWVSNGRKSSSWSCNLARKKTSRVQDFYIVPIGSRERIEPCNR